MNYSYCGFRFSAFPPNDHIFTCQYIKNFPQNVPEELRMCNKIGTYNENRILPACDEHVELYNIMWSSLSRPVISPFVSTQNNIQKKNFEQIPRAIIVSEECCVCYSKENKLLTACQHVICFPCYHSLENLNCPVCRCSIDQFLYRL